MGDDFKTDRELLLSVRDKQESIHRDQSEKFGVVFGKLDNYGHRLSETEKEIIRHEGVQRLLHQRQNDFAEDLKKAPDVYKAMVVFGVIITLLQAAAIVLGVR